MITKTEGRAGGSQAAPKTSKSTLDFTRFASRIKTLIVTLTLWGVLPVGVAEWMICRGGLRDV